MDSQEFRENGHALIDWIAEFMETMPERRVESAVQPGDVRAALPAHPPTAPESFGEVMKDV
jgi:aromatic-L-amino-acid/L-tryptophan decarboxylase